MLAIAGILLGIAIPTAVTLQKDMRLAKLDAAARSVFIAAQNRLTALRSADGLDAVQAGNSALVDGYPDLVYAENPGGDQKLFDTVLPKNAVDEKLIQNGHVVIEYEPLSGSVYSVFYAERGEDFAYAADLPRDDRPARRDAMLGYYGGDAVTLPGTETILEPSVELVNGEELALEIDNSGITDLSYITEVLPNLTYHVSLAPADKPEQTVEIRAEYLEETDVGCRVVLDSITGSRHFADVVRGADGKPEIEPGADIIVSLTIDFNKSGVIAKPYKWSGRTNSLFASREKDESTKQETVILTKGRHLQNLEPTVSGIGTSGGYAAVRAKVSSKIDWTVYQEKTVTAPGGGAVGAGGQMVPPKELAKQGGFVPIQNASLSSFDGNNQEIKNLRVEPVEDRVVNAGLFAQFGKAGAASALKDTVLVNPYIKAGQSGTAGALAGVAENTSVDNCRAYLDTDGVANLKASPDKPPYGVFASGSTLAGGLMGSVKKSDDAAQSYPVTKSFAALPAVTSGTVSGRAGGFAGELGAGTAVRECYASAGTVAAHTSGGFAGAVSGTVKECYASAAVRAKYAYGFFTGGTGSFANCYAAVSYQDTADANDPIGFGNRGNIGSATGCYYVVDIINGPTRAETDPDGVKPIAYRTLGEMDASVFGNGGWSASNRDTTHPYLMTTFDKLPEATQKQIDDKLYSAAVYPFPRLKTAEHYGDWPLPAKTGALLYYERYADGSYGIEGLQADGTAYPNRTLPLRSDKAVTADGYAVAGEFGASVRITLGKQGEQTLNRDTALSALLSGSSAYPLTAPLVQTDASFADGFYQSVAVGGSTVYLWFNPHFARTVQKGEKVPAEPERIAVRTARQLSALAAHSEYWGKRFTQQRDIDFSSYTFLSGLSTKQTPIGTEKTAFSGVYDGSCHTITGTGIAAESAVFAGLFGYSTGTLENIVFRADGAVIEGGIYAAGALAGYSAGTVRNCAAAGFTVRTDSKFAGGLIGQADGGTVEGSSAANRAVQASGYAGGLIGWSTGTQFTNNCYATGRLSGIASLGGMIGAVEYDASPTIQNCYSACTVESGATVYGIGPKGVSDSYYLADTVKPAVTEVPGAAGLRYGQLEIQTLPGMGAAAHTFPYERSGSYPFPAVVTDGAGERVHYGDWPEKTAAFGEVAIGVCVRTAVDYNKPETTFQIWGTDEQGNWSQDAVETFTVNKAIDRAFYACTGSGMAGVGRWYVWNSSMSGQSAAHLNQVQSTNEIALNGYEFYIGNDLFVSGKTMYYYKEKPNGAGSGDTPPQGWAFSISNTIPPRFETNQN